MIKLKVPYARDALEFAIPEANFAGEFKSGIHDYCPEAGETELVNRAFDAPVDSPRLEELASKVDNAVIIASDHTRPVPSKVIIPPMLERLRAGNPAIDITILIATGFHRATTREELIDKFGLEIVEKEKIVVHDSRDSAAMVSLGTLPSGGELLINRLAAEAGLLLSEGFIEPHFFAGFSGGRKSVLPGIASAQTVLANHCSEFIRSEYARTGNLENNPLHRDMVFAARQAKLAFILNVVINAEKQVINAFAGHFEQAHLAGCRFLSGLCGIRAPEADIVITGNGGYPLDQNIYQAVKGMTAAEAVCRPGGTIIMAAACADGHGGQSFFDAMAEAESPSEVLERAAGIPRNRTKPDQWEYQILARILSRFNVIMVTGHCDPAMIRAMHMEHAPTPETALRMAFDREGEKARVAVIPDGVAVIAEKNSGGKMNITVCVKQVPGTTEVGVDPETGVLKRDGVDSKMNPYDLYALETALRFKDKNNANITALTMGPPQAEEIIREAFMMGTDRGLVLSDRRFAGADVLSTAYTLAQGIRHAGMPELIICGKQTTDGDTAQVGAEIAEFLNIPHLTNVVRIVEVKAESLIVEVDMPQHLETAEIPFPCLIAVDKDIFEPRLPSYRLKLATADKPVEWLSLDELKDTDAKHYGLNGSPTQVIRIFPPENDNERELWEGNGELMAEKLFDKLKDMKFLQQTG